MPSIFKSLTPSDINKITYPGYYDYSYLYVSGSTTNSDVRILHGKKYTTASGLRVEDNEQELFDSVVQMFYSPIAYAQSGTTATSYIPSGSVYVISVTQDLFGEKIVPKTFSINVGTSSSFDDGYGNLVISSSGTGYIIGRIFYDKGIALYKPTASIAGGGLNSTGLYVTNGTNVIVNFTSSMTVRETTLTAVLNPTDFLYSFNNPTVTSDITGSDSRPIDLMWSGSLKPYVTTIGFYNENNELLLVAKPSVAIQRTADSIQTFIVKYDI